MTYAQPRKAYAGKTSSITSEGNSGLQTVLKSSPSTQEKEGRWMTFSEIERLGRHWSYLELMEILEVGISPVPSREVQSPDPVSNKMRTVKQYFIASDSLSSFTPANF